MPVAAGEIKLLAATGLGGGAGSLARYGLGQALPVQPGSFPATTLLINLSGSLLLGLLVGVVAARPGLPPLTRPLLGTGVLGGYTTFSAFALDIHTLSAASITGYLIASVVGGMLCAFGGLRAADAVVGARAVPLDPDLP